MTATDYGTCVACGIPRRWHEVIDPPTPDDGLCSSCFQADWSLYLAEVAARGARPVQPERKEE